MGDPAFAKVTADGRMHWSYPAALRFLRVLRAHGWQATTWQIGEAYRTAAAHSDAASVRAMFRECGVEDWQGSVGCEFVTRSEEDRHVYRYWIPRGLRDLAERVLRWEREHPTPRGARPDFVALGRPARVEQASLFSGSQK